MTTHEAKESLKHITPSPEQLRALTHPIRLRLLGILRLNGPQTATDLAKITHLNTGSTSYHLRMLAKYGFIEKDESHSSGRKLFWKTKQFFNIIDAPDEHAANADDSLDAAAGFMQVAATESTRQIMQSASTWKDLEPSWRDATILSNFVMQLNADEAKAISKQVQDILFEAMRKHPFPRDNGLGTDTSHKPSPDAKAVSMQFHLFPLPQDLLK